MIEDRDELVAKALRDLPVPDHAPDFWAELEHRLAGTSATESARARATALDPEEASDDAEQHELAAGVVSMAERRPMRRRRRVLSVAALLVVIAGAAAVLTRPARGPERVRTASTIDGATVSTPTTTPAPAEPTATADRAVLAWLGAVATGDIDTATRLTGPRSVAYADAITGGAGVGGILVEAGEGYGAWADSPDRSTTSVELATADEEITVVIVSGTWAGEGGPQTRTDAIPAVRTESGQWLVEPWAIDPATGGRIDVLSPTAAEEGGFNGLAPDGVLTARAPGPGGTFHFSLDHAPATSVAAEAVDGGGVRATFDPPGRLSSRTHQFLIAYVDERTISTLAGTIVVEG